MNYFKSHNPAAMPLTSMKWHQTWVAAEATACALGKKMPLRATRSLRAFGAGTLLCLNLALAPTCFASSLQDFPKIHEQEANVPTDQANEALQQKLRETEERRKAYYNYVYTDEQRQEAIQLIMDAMAVLRGEQAFSSILRRYKIWGQTRNVGSWRENLGGHRENVDVLNEWTPAYFTLSDSKNPSPYYFFLKFTPAIRGINRQQLEEILKLKVAYGWKKEGGNMIRPAFDIHTGIQSKMAVLEYSPIEEPKGDYTIEVTLEYLDTKDSFLDGLYAATNELASVRISRTYLSPEEKSKRSRERVGHLSR